MPDSTSRSRPGSTVSIRSRNAGAVRIETILFSGKLELRALSRAASNGHGGGRVNSGGQSTDQPVQEGLLVVYRAGAPDAQVTVIAVTGVSRRAGPVGISR